MYSSSAQCRQGLEWKDSTGAECCQANTMEGEGKRDKGIFKGSIIIKYMGSGMSKEDVRR